MSAHGPRLRHVLVAHDGYRSPLLGRAGADRDGIAAEGSAVPGQARRPELADACVERVL
jgi:hypothetical protein